MTQGEKIAAGLGVLLLGAAIYYGVTKKSDAASHEPRTNPNVDPNEAMEDGKTYSNASGPVRGAGCEVGGVVARKKEWYTTKGAVGQNVGKPGFGYFKADGTEVRKFPKAGSVKYTNSKGEVFSSNL